jgi:hypothetical protein
MKHINNILKQTLVWFYLAASLLTACTPSPTVSTSPIPTKTTPDTPAQTVTPMPLPSATSMPLSDQTATPSISSEPDLWKMHNCNPAPSVLEKYVYDWWWLYTGDVADQGVVDMLLNFTQSNEILGYYFDNEQVREYQVRGCVEGRAFTIWLYQDNNIEAVIRGEFPETDPRGHFSSSEALKGDVIIGSITEKANPQSIPIYLKLLMGTAGTVEHRFGLAGVEDDTVILNAAQSFLAAVANDNRTQLVQMIQFPLEFQKDGRTIMIQTSDSLLSQYDVVFDDDFKARLAKTFPNYLIANSGNFIGTIGLSVYSGGGVIFDDHGKITAISNWQKPEIEPTPTFNPEGTK